MALVVSTGRTPASTSSRPTGSSAVGPTSRSRARASRAPRSRRRFAGSTRRAASTRSPSRTGAGRVELVRGGDGELDTELVDRHGLDGIGYTPRLDEATAAVDRGAADVAFLLREPRVEAVFATARARQAHAAEEHVLLSQAALGPALPPGAAVTPGSTSAGCASRTSARCSRVCRRAPSASPCSGVGQGGDDTTAIDQAAEDAVVERLAALAEDFVLVSEELGQRMFGAGGARHVVVDPIDGSVNAKRGIPFFSFSLAVAEGATMDDVVFGYVYDFGSGEEWTAERGAGAFLDGVRLGSQRPKETLEILSFEGTTTPIIAEQIGATVGLATRLRVMGSLALSLCHLAAGRVDGVVSLKAARSVDIAAAQLLVRECGLAIELFEDPPFGDAPLDLATRSRVAAAGTPELVEQLATALRAP